MLIDPLSSSFERIFLGPFDGVAASKTYGANEWDDDLATGDTGWTYNGDGTWTGVNVLSKDIYITNLGDLDSTYLFIFEIISTTSGTVAPKLRGSIGTKVSAVEEYTEEVINTLVYAHTGLVGVDGFSGVVKIKAVKKLI